MAKDTKEGQQAMAALCERYWLPLYAFARRSGCNPPDAEDMTQGFIYTIIRSNGLKTADASKGRLRLFLMAGMKNHIISVHRKQTTQVRGADKIVHNLTLEQAEQLLAEDKSAYASHAESPAQVFERRWALALLIVSLSDSRVPTARKGNPNSILSCAHFSMAGSNLNLTTVPTGKWERHSEFHRIL